jgi:hypothetical protein
VVQPLLTWLGRWDLLLLLLVLVLLSRLILLLQCWVQSCDR